MESQKKDIHNIKKGFQTALLKLENNNEMIRQNRDLILKFIRDCRLGKTLKNRQKKIIGEARCLKYIHILKKLSKWLDKPFDEAKQIDIERIIENLENNKYVYKLKSKKDCVIKLKELSHSTKVDYKNTLRKFYKWLLGKNKFFPKIVDWIDTYDVIKEIPSIKREEVEKIADYLNIRDKTIVMFLFDSGARVEEFLNIRICDLTEVDGVFKVRIVHSKTKPRTIHLPIASKYINLWLNEIRTQNLHEYLFSITYNSLRMMLHRAGKKVLNRNINPHLLRHSSATHYANFLNHHQLCYRYGWTMASNMPNRYLDREGIFEKETVEVIKGNEVANLEKKNQELGEKLVHVKQSNEYLTKQFQELKEKYDQIFQGKDFFKVIMSLAEKQNKMSKVVEKLSGEKFDMILNLE